MISRNLDFPFTRLKVASISNSTLGKVHPKFSIYQCWAGTLILLKPAASRWVSKYFSESEDKELKRNQITAAADFSYFERPIKFLHERISKAVFNLAFPKILRTICYIHTYISRIGCFEYLRITVNMNLKNQPDDTWQGFGAASNTCTTTRVFTIYRICQHLFQWQDRAVQCTNSDLSFRVRQSALIYNSGVPEFDALRW